MDTFFIVIGVLLALFVLFVLIRGFFLTKSERMVWDGHFEAAETLKTNEEKPLREVSHDTSLYAWAPPGSVWTEIELSDCQYGCKIYENSVTGERALAHNSTHGCYK